MKTLGQAFAVVGALALAGAAQAQVILCNNAREDVCYVLDGNTGDVIGTFDTGFSTTGVNIIDGHGTNLLLCDRDAGAIWELNSDGSFNGQFNNDPVFQPNGIDLFPTGQVLVGASEGIVVFTPNGDRMQNKFLPGMFCDEFFDEGLGLCHVSNFELGNLQAYDANFVLHGQSEPGSCPGPAQINPVVRDGVMLCATCSIDTASVKVFEVKPNAPLAYEFPVDGKAFGVLQLPRGNILVTTNTGIHEHTVDGAFVRTIASGKGFLYLEYSDNFVQ